MAQESPLFQSALELFGHAITHFNAGEELDRKLVILHLANSVELILKDLMLDKECSIYNNPKETVSVHGAVKALNGMGVKLRTFHKIELLIDERNALQHRFGSPNELTALYYMEAAHNFFREAMLEHYDLDLEEVLPQFLPERDLVAYRLRRPTNESELENLKKLASVHPVGALLAAHNYMERAVREFLDRVASDAGVAFRRPTPFSSALLRHLGVELGDDLSDSLAEMRQLRNSVAHGRTEPSPEDVNRMVDVIEKLEAKLEEYSDPERMSALRAEAKRLEMERKKRFEEAKRREFSDQEDEFRRQVDELKLKLANLRDSKD